MLPLLLCSESLQCAVRQCRGGAKK